MRKGNCYFYFVLSSTIFKLEKFSRKFFSLGASFPVTNIDNRGLKLKMGRFIREFLTSINYFVS